MADVQVSERDREAGRDAANSWLEGHNPLALGAIIAQAIAQARAEERAEILARVQLIEADCRDGNLSPLDVEAAIRARGEK